MVVPSVMKIHLRGDQIRRHRALESSAVSAATATRCQGTLHQQFGQWYRLQGFLRPPLALHQPLGEFDDEAEVVGLPVAAVSCPAGMPE
jgi:hypothetical protein